MPSFSRLRNTVALGLTHRGIIKGEGREYHIYSNLAVVEQTPAHILFEGGMRATATGISSGKYGRVVEIWAEPNGKAQFFEFDCGCKPQ